MNNELSTLEHISLLNRKISRLEVDNTHLHQKLIRIQELSEYVCTECKFKDEKPCTHDCLNKDLMEILK